MALDSRMEEAATGELNGQANKKYQVVSVRHVTASFLAEQDEMMETKHPYIHSPVQSLSGDDYKDKKTSSRERGRPARTLYSSYPIPHQMACEVF